MTSILNNLYFCSLKSIGIFIFKTKKELNKYKKLYERDSKYTRT